MRGTHHQILSPMSTTQDTTYSHKNIKATEFLQVYNKHRKQHSDVDQSNFCYQTSQFNLAGINWNYINFLLHSKQIQEDENIVFFFMFIWKTLQKFTLTP